MPYMGLFVDRQPDRWKILGAVPRWLYEGVTPGADGGIFASCACELSSRQAENISSYLRIISDMPVMP